MKFFKGFSLVEMIVVLGIILAVVAVSFGSFKYLKSDSELSEAEMLLVRMLENARTKSATGFGTMNHGVHITANSLVAFEGGAYVEGVGIEIGLPPGVSTDHSSTTILFSRINARPDTGAIINLSSSTGSSTSVEVTSEGAVLTD